MTPEESQHRRQATPGTTTDGQPTDAHGSQRGSARVESIAIDVGAAGTRLLGPTLFGEGFSVDECSTWSITFRDERRSLELSCYREDPTPWLNVVLGLRTSDEHMSVALCRLYPDVAALRSLAMCRIDSAELLVTRLEMVHDSWLPALIWPAFEQPERFLKAWQARRREAEETYVADALQQRLLRARWAYDRGEFAKAVEQYALAGLPDLSAADNRRYVLARRHSNPRSASEKSSR